MICITVAAVDSRFLQKARKVHHGWKSARGNPFRAFDGGQHSRVKQRCIAVRRRSFNNRRGNVFVVIAHAQHRAVMNMVIVASVTIGRIA